LTCSDGIPTDCACDETTGSITGTSINKGTFVLKDQLFIPLTNSNGTQVCIPSSGNLVITTGSGAVLRLQFSGLACKGPNPNWSLLGGSYGVASGTDRFATAVGTGTLSRTKNVADNSTTLSLIGNIGNITP